MLFHNLSHAQRMSYLSAIKTTLQLLYEAKEYDSIEKHYNQFKQDWGGVKDNGDIDAIADDIVILYYYAKLQSVLDVTVEKEQLNELTLLKKKIQNNDFFQKYNNKITAVNGNIGINIPADPYQLLMQNYDNKISELTVGNFLKLRHEEIATISIDNITAQDFTDTISKILDKLSAKLMTDNLSLHPLYSPLIEKIKDLHIIIFDNENIKANNVHDKVFVFEKMCAAQERLKQYSADFLCLDPKINDLAVVIKKDILSEIEHFISSDFKTNSSSQNQENNKKMQHVVEALLVENLFNEVNGKKQIFIVFLSYANKLITHASTDDDIALSKSNLYLIKNVALRLSLNELNEAITRFQLRIDLAETNIMIKWLKGGEENSDTEFRTSPLYNDFINKVRELEARIVNTNEAEPSIEILKTKLLMHYLLVYYYSILMLQYQSFDELDSLRNNMLENYKKAISLTKILTSRVDLSFTEDSSLIEKCNALYNKHYRFNITYLTESVIENIEKANRLYDAYHLEAAVGVFEECLALINQFPALVINNNQINHGHILWSLARIYRDLNLFEKAHPYFRDIMIKNMQISAEERYEIKAFFTQYLTITKNEHVYFELRNTQKQLSLSISSDINGLKKILLEGAPLDVQREAFKDLISCFNRDETIFHQFAAEVTQAFLDLESRNAELRAQKRKPEKFRCYHQVLFDIATNIHLRSLQLPPNIDAQKIFNEFSQLAVQAGNPQACYDYALSLHNSLNNSPQKYKNYSLISRKLAIALDDVDWASNEKNAAKKEKAIALKAQADAALLSAHNKEPLRFFRSEKELWLKTMPSADHREVAEIETLLRSPTERVRGEGEEALYTITNSLDPEKTILKRNSDNRLPKEPKKMTGKRKLKFDDKEHHVKLFAYANKDEKPEPAHKDTKTYKIRQSFTR